jgi:hypothetical protein
MVPIEHVPWWVIEAGIGHALVAEGVGHSAWDETLCGAIGHFKHRRSTLPNRICRTCRAILASDEVHLIDADGRGGAA